MYHRWGSGGRVPSRRRLWGSGGKAPSRWAIFVSFWKKKRYFNPIESHFARVQSHLKELDFYHLKVNRKNLTVQSSFYLQLKSKTRLKSCIIV